MVRYAIAMVLACIYIAGAAWVVGNEGRSYRDSLHPASPEAGTAEPPPAGPGPEVEVARKEDAIMKPAQPRAEPPPAKPIAVAEIPSPVAASMPPSRAVAPTPPPRAVPQPATGDRAADLAPWKNDPIWSQPYLAKSWNLDGLTIQDENQLGDQLHGLILQLNSEDRGPGLRRVNEAARPLLELVQPKGRQYRFSVLNSEVANAFSHPGGYIYVSSKLLEMIPEDEDYLLEFVLGHEMAHVELQHALGCLRNPSVRTFSDGTLQKLYLLIIPRGYFDEQEYAADEWVYHRMKRLKRSEHECLKFLRMLDKYANAHGFVNGRGQPEELLKEKAGEPEGSRRISLIDNHLRRIRRLMSASTV